MGHVSQRTALVLAVSGCFALGWIARGKWAPEIKSEQKIIMQEKEERALAYVGTTSTKERMRTDTRWRVKTIRLPSGQVETTTEVCQVEGRETETKKEESGTMKEKTETKREETKIVNHVGESWRLAVRGGVDTVGRVAGVEVSRRMVGPLWVGAWVDGWQGRIGGGASLGVQW